MLQICELGLGIPGTLSLSVLARRESLEKSPSVPQRSFVDER